MGVIDRDGGLCGQGDCQTLIRFCEGVRLFALDADHADDPFGDLDRDVQPGTQPGKGICVARVVLQISRAHRHPVLNDPAAESLTGPGDHRLESFLHRLTLVLRIQARLIEGQQFERLILRVVQADGRMMPVHFLIEQVDDLLGNSFRIYKSAQGESALVEHFQFAQALDGLFAQARRMDRPGCLGGEKGKQVFVRLGKPAHRFIDLVCREHTDQFTLIQHGHFQHSAQRSTFIRRRAALPGRIIIHAQRPAGLCNASGHALPELQA